MLNKLAPLLVISLVLLWVGSVQAASKLRRPLPCPVQVTPMRARPRQIWCAHKHQTLKSALGDWATGAGWVVQWDAGYDYPILATACFSGSFVKALQGVSQAYRDAERPLYLDLYLKQRLVVITQ